MMAIKTPHPTSAEPGLGGKFDPLSLDLLSRNLREGLEATDRLPFPPPVLFPGAGLYALYYVGEHELYRRLKGTDIPVYVGKAEAGNSSYGDPSDDVQPKLYRRIAEKHAVSVDEVTRGLGNIRCEDFEVRYLNLDDVWIVLGERALLRAYAPVLWNTIMPGFGANPPGTARRNARSVWDSLHPGRPRAGSLCSRRYTRQEMSARVARAIDISLMPDGSSRQDTLDRLRAERANMIWSPAKKDEKDKRPRVFRVEAFLAENQAIGTDVGEDWIDAAGDTSAMLPDPEEAAESNILAAESSEADAD
jgi:hypothetical protein